MSTPSSRQERRSRRAERKLAEERARRRRQFSIFGGLVVIAIAAVVVLIVLNRPGQGSNLPAMVAAPAPDPAIPTNGMTMGDPNASVTVVEWGDYQ